MDYPELIRLDPETETALQVWLEQQLITHYAERGAFLEDLKNYQKDYLAKPSVVENTFPFQGSSNIVIPLAAITAETTFANEMQQLFGIDQFCSVKLADQFSPLDHEIEKYLDWEYLKGVDIREALAAPVMEKIKFGTSFARMDYKKVVKRTTIGGIARELTVSQGNKLEFVSISRFLMPFSCLDAQTATWCGEEHETNVADFRSLVASGLFYDDVITKLEPRLSNPVQSTATLSSDPYKQVIEVKTNTQPVWPTNLTWVQIWTAFDVNKDKKDEEICVYYNRDYKIILGVRYNWFEDLRRPYRRVIHLPVEGRWYGLGACQQLEQFQREITTIHRQRLDNATVANARVWRVKRGANINPNTPIYPGKFFEVDEADDISPLQMGDIYASAFSNEQQALYFAQQRSGTNELTIGQQQSGTPGTASSDLARLQEAKRRYDYTFRNTKEFVDNLILDGVCNIQQFGHRNIRYFDFVPQGELIKQFFKLPQDLIRQQIIAQISTIGSQENKLVDRNNWTQLAGMMSQYYTGALQLSEAIGNPQLTQAIATKALMGSTEAFKQICESFDVRNIGRITLDGLLNDLFKLSSAGTNQVPEGAAEPLQIPSTSSAP